VIKKESAIGPFADSFFFMRALMEVRVPVIAHKNLPLPKKLGVKQLP
jgi:hypothetical protein